MDWGLDPAEFQAYLIDQKNMDFFRPMDSDGESHFYIAGTAGAGDDDRRRSSLYFRPGQRIQQGWHEVRFPQDGDVDIWQQGGWSVNDPRLQPTPASPIPQSPPGHR